MKYTLKDIDIRVTETEIGWQYIFKIDDGKIHLYTQFDSNNRWPFVDKSIEWMINYSIDALLHQANNI